MIRVVAVREHGYAARVVLLELIHRHAGPGSQLVEVGERLVGVVELLQRLGTTPDLDTHGRHVERGHDDSPVP